MTNLDFSELERLGEDTLQAWNRSPTGEYDVVRLKSDGVPVACLVCLGRTGTPVFLPIVAGRTYVVRSSASDFDEADCARLGGVLEAAQWKFEWAASGATVSDDCSTGGSVLVEKQLRMLASLNLGELHSRRVGRILGWNGKVEHRDFVKITSGDVLVNQYRAFVFCTVQ